MTCALTRAAGGNTTLAPAAKRGASRRQAGGRFRAADEAWPCRLVAAHHESLLAPPVGQAAPAVTHPGRGLKSRQGEPKAVEEPRGLLRSFKTPCALPNESFLA